MKKLFLLMGALLVAGGGCALGPQTPPTTREVIEPLVHIVNPDQMGENATTTSSSVLTTTSSPELPTTTLRVVWHAPVTLPDLHLFGSQAPTTTYRSVGTVQGGAYNGGDIILTSLDVCMIGAGPEEVGYYRFVRTAKGTTLITNFSSETNYTDEFCLGWNVVPTVDQRAFLINDLMAPDAITDSKTRQSFTLDTRSVAQEIPTYKIVRDTPLFTDMSGRTVYTDLHENGTDVYLRAPDGTRWHYVYAAKTGSLADTATSWSREVSPIVWNGGVLNTSTAYVFDDGSNDCRRIDATYAFASQVVVTDADLVVAGTDSQNNPVYKLKDPNHPLLMNMHQAKDGLYDLGPVHDRVYIFWRDPFGRLLRLIDSLYIEGCGGKPVIYLYPQTRTPVTVQVAPVGGFTRTVPLYPESGWRVVAHPSGRIEYQGNNYPYLFWEGGLGSYTMPSQGFVVDAREVPSLLTRSLHTIGLNTKEIADFNEFWVPRLTGYPYYFITFSINERVESYAPLSINPRPDTVIRVLMDYKPLRESISVEPLVLTPTPRYGFTVVEWGGILK